MPIVQDKFVLKSRKIGIKIDYVIFSGGLFLYTVHCGGHIFPLLLTERKQRRLLRKYFRFFKSPLIMPASQKIKHYRWPDWPSFFRRIFLIVIFSTKQSRERTAYVQRTGFGTFQLSMKSKDNNVHPR